MDEIAKVMKSRYAGLIEADLISSEVAHRRFHPNSLGFHPAKQDFIIKSLSSEVVCAPVDGLFACVKIMGIR